MTRILLRWMDWLDRRADALGEELGRTMIAGRMCMGCCAG